MGRAGVRLLVVALALLAGAAVTAFLARGGESESAAPVSPSSIQGPQVRLGDLVYNLTEMRILELDRPDDAPYLINQPRRPKGNAYLGVFLRIYNLNPDEEQPSAPGYLLEPTNGSRAAMVQSSESPYQLVLGSTVPAGGQLPEPGSTADGGPFDGASLVYVINSDMTAAQPFRLVVHTGAETGAIPLPRVPLLEGGGH